MLQRDFITQRHSDGERFSVRIYISPHPSGGSDAFPIRSISERASTDERPV